MSTHTVDPDRWLTALDGRWYPRQVKADGCVMVDGLAYYVKQALAGRKVLLRLNAQARCFDVLSRDQVLKQMPIKGLQGQLMALDAYVALSPQQDISEARCQAAGSRGSLRNCSLEAYRERRRAW